MHRDNGKHDKNLKEKRNKEWAKENDFFNMNLLRGATEKSLRMILLQRR